MRWASGPGQENAALGIAVIVVTGFTMAFGDALVKRISADFTVPQIFVLRSLLAIPLSIALLLVTRRPARILPRSMAWALLRSALLVLMWIAFYAALPVLSLPVVAAAYYTGPLFIALFAALLTGRPVGRTRWTAVVVGFIGVLVIVKPGTEAFSAATLLPVAAALFYALAAIVTRTRCGEDEPLALSLALNVSFLAAGGIATAAIALWEPTAAQVAASSFLFGPWAAMGGREWGLIALLAALIVATSAGVAKAYQSGPPAIIATFDYGYLVFAAFWSFVFFADVPDVMTAAGMLLIAGAGLLVIPRPASAVRTSRVASPPPGA